MEILLLPDDGTIWWQRYQGIDVNVSGSSEDDDDRDPIVVKVATWDREALPLYMLTDVQRLENYTRVKMFYKMKRKTARDRRRRALYNRARKSWFRVVQ